MGHAETATTPELMERIASWLHSVLGQTPARTYGAEVCDDMPRE
jgi:hypothetical protein